MCTRAGTRVEFEVLSANSRGIPAAEHLAESSESYSVPRDTIALLFNTQTGQLVI